MNKKNKKSPFMRYLREALPYMTPTCRFPSSLTLSSSLHHRNVRLTHARGKAIKRLDNACMINTPETVSFSDYIPVGIPADLDVRTTSKIYLVAWLQCPFSREMERYICEWISVSWMRILNSSFVYGKHVCACYCISLYSVINPISWMNKLNPVDYSVSMMINRRFPYIEHFPFP